jgi:hypothetical protein
MTRPLFGVFCVLLTVTLAFALRRLIIVKSKGDECLHVLDAEAPLIEKQQMAANQLQSVDTWGKVLTMATLLAGIGAYCSWWLGL